MLTNIHFLLTYSCNFTCDHCFLYCGPQAKGTFTVTQLRSALDEIKRSGVITGVCFEGGEPSLYYPLMVEGVRYAKQLGLGTGIVTNAYWAISAEDAELWLEPLVRAGIGNISVSDDAFHYGTEIETPAKRAIAAGKKLGVSIGALSTQKPGIKPDGTLSGTTLFKGRAVEKLAEGMPRRSWRTMTTCPCEKLADPARVHLDSYGYMHLCQGLCMGNVYETPLTDMVKSYSAEKHPLCRLLSKGGPAALAEEYNVPHEKEYIHECHFCYELRLKLLDRFPQYLAPRQVYGL
jgi:hypothetical protein